MYRPLHIAHLLVIGKSIHRFHLDINITILYPAPNITLIFLFHFRIICDNDFPVIIHILIGLFTSFSLLFLITFFIISHGLIAITYTILLVKLRFHDFKLVHFSTFTVADLSPCLCTLIISGQKVRIHINHSCIIFNGSPVIPRLCTK